MQQALLAPEPLPVDSPDRLAALRATGLLDSPNEVAFDRLTKLAAAALHVPVAMISLVDSDRQFFKSQCGLPLEWAEKRGTPRSHSFCQHVVNLDEPLTIRDAREHDLVRNSPLIQQLNVIAYAGVPIRDEDGYVLGSFCAIDDAPRDWSAGDVELLQAFSAQATLEIKLRTQSMTLAGDLDQHREREENRRAMSQLTVHDLRTPLSAILSSLSLIHRLGPLNDKQSAYVAMCTRNGRALQNIVDNLLDVGSVEHRGGAALHQTECVARTLINSALDQVHALATEKQIGLAVETNETLPTLHADADKITRVLVNLLANAIKFTPPAGQIHLTAKACGEGSPSHLHFSITDDGIGMADTRQIFDEGVRLNSAAPTRKSAGLGLTFCKKIVEAHGGKIWVESVPDEGSTFHFTLPLAPAACAAA